MAMKPFVDWWRRLSDGLRPPPAGTYYEYLGGPPVPVPPYARPVPPADLRPWPIPHEPLADAILEELRRHVLVTLVDMWLDYRHERSEAALEQMLGAVRGMYLAGLLDRDTRDEWEAKIASEGT